MPSVYSRGLFKEYKKYPISWWRGKKVRSLQEICNGHGCLPAGTIFKVTGKLKGFEIESDPCDKCGFKLRITKVSPSELELVESQQVDNA